MVSKKIMDVKKQPPQGFYYFPNFISENEEEALLKKIKSLKWQEVKMHGIVAKRRVVHFGLDYAYDSRSVKLTTPPPPFLIESRSAYILSGSARREWQHSIPPVKSNRYSITFRTLRKK